MSSPTLLLGREDLAAIVERLGAEIAADHPDGVVLVGVLKGALIFLSDLARAIRGIDVAIDFMAISRFAPDSGRVKILKDVELDLSGRDVILVEDMVDTGLTATYLRGQLAERGPRRLDLCTLLDRPVRRIVPLEVRYRGAEIPDVFALGYGLHLAELYRNLDQVYIADQRAVRAEPMSYVQALYGAGSGREAAGGVGRGGRRGDPRDPLRGVGGACSRCNVGPWTEAQFVIRVSLVGVRVEVPSNQPIVLLREVEGQRYLPIFIGPPEATAIVYALQGMDTPRPMTHDLFKTVLDDLSVRVDRVVITQLQEGTFYAEVELAREGGALRISSRPSDAIALAVRYEEPVPIFVEEAVLDEAGVLFEAEEDEEQIEQFREFLEQVSPEDFGA